MSKDCRRLLQLSGLDEGPYPQPTPKQHRLQGLLNSNRESKEELFPHVRFIGAYCGTCYRVISIFKEWEGRQCNDPFKDPIEVGDGLTFIRNGCDTCHELIFLVLQKRIDVSVPLQVLVRPDGFVMRPSPSTWLSIAPQLQRGLNFLRAADVNSPYLHYNALSKNKIDVSLLRSWTQLCDVNFAHKGVCHTITRYMGLAPPKKITFVDVHAMCLVDIDRVPRTEDGGIMLQYATLSYVWGGVATLTTTQSNVEELHKKKALEKWEFWSKLPATIKDALLLVKDLGLKYLWVDSLCITQDAEDHISKQIGQMASIYYFSYLTIVVIDGKFSDAGIPGVGTTSRYFRTDAIRLDRSGEVLRPVRDHRDFIEENTRPWHTRAWTFQERALSRRNLVFHNNTVYWECRLITCPEELENRDAGFDVNVTEKGLMLPNRSSLQPSDEAYPSYALDQFDSPDLAAYFKYVEGFTIRQLSFQRDALKAFSAFTTALAPSFDKGFFWGLPEYHFDRALFWITKQPLDRRHGFPSWSWLGWNGPVSLALSDSRGTLTVFSSHEPFYIPLVTWYKRRLADGFFVPVENAAYKWNLKDWATEAAHNELQSIGWTRKITGPLGFFHSNHPDQIYPRPFPSGSQRERSLGGEFPNIDHGIDDVSTQESTYEPYLYLKTKICTFQVDQPSHHSGRYLDLYDNDSGTWAGLLVQTLKERSSNTIPQTAQVIAVSRITEDCYFTNIDEDELDGAGLLFRDLRFGYNIMWVKNYEDIWYRMGVGRVFKSVWKKQLAEKIEIKLG